jgi:hypothetical protein
VEKPTVIADRLRQRVRTATPPSPTPTPGAAWASGKAQGHPAYLGPKAGLRVCGVGFALAGAVLRMRDPGFHVSIRHPRRGKMGFESARAGPCRCESPLGLAIAILPVCNLSIGGSNHPSRSGKIPVATGIVDPRMRRTALGSSMTDRSVCG